MSFYQQTPPWRRTPPLNNRTKVTDANNAKAAKENSAAVDVAAAKNARNKKIIGNSKPASTVSSSNQVTVKETKVNFNAGIRYNAPMINHSYFGANSFQSHVMGGRNIEPPYFTDAKYAWTSKTESLAGVQFEKYFSGKGAIQMDALFLKEAPIPVVPGKKTDTNRYGFKFHYNPQTVSMAWGVLADLDPPYQYTGQDKFQVISAGLLRSTVTFQLLLNRTYDFNYVTKNGVLKYPNPYPEYVPKEKVSEIWEKGTMHDIEYLLRTINGPNADFESDLNFIKSGTRMTTADRAWLRPTIVELHLGNAMRYRVRIAEFAVNHVIFNDRMVPMMSTINITCNRFADGIIANNLPWREVTEADAKAATARAGKYGREKGAPGAGP